MGCDPVPRVCREFRLKVVNKQLSEKTGLVPRVKIANRSPFNLICFDAFSRIRPSMGLRRCFVALLLVGFWLSIHGRMEPDFDTVHPSSEFHASHSPHQHENSPQKPADPAGAHKDQHGCYHSHAPFVAVSTSFSCEPATSTLVTAALEILRSPIPNTILHPPRA